MINPSIRFIRIALIVCTLVVLTAPARAADFTWDGNGDDNNGGVWSDPANWDVGAGFPADTNDTADLQATLSSDRFISNDVATTIGTIVMEDHTRHHLVLDADLSVDTIDGGHDKYLSHIDVNGNTLTLGQTLGPGAYTPKLDGPGTFVKVSTGTSVLNGEDEYTGSIIVSNGVLSFRSAAWDTTTLMTVLDGATAAHIGSAADLPTNIVINGNGFNGNGAIHFTSTETCASRVTVNTDSKMKSSGTTTFTGDIDGSGELTLEGPGTWILGGTGVPYTNTLIITDGTVQVPGDFPNLLNVLVDSGGVLEALQSQLPNATIVTQNGGVWNQPTSAAWTGGGDGSNWFDVANWSPAVVPTEQADLRQSLSSPRYIRIDSNATVVTVLMEDDTDNNVVLDANWTVDTFGNEHNIYNSRVDVNGHTLTAGRSTSANNYFPKLDGPGTFIKNTTGTCTLQTEDEFTGTIIVSNGTLQFRSALWDTTILLTVLDGGTAQLQEPGPSFPTNIAINGTGFGGAGAINFTGSDTSDSDIIVSTDSKMKQLGGTTTLSGDIDGTGCLTLQGPGTWILAGTGVTYTNKLKIFDGTVQVTGDFPDLQNVVVDSGGVLEAVPSQFPSASIVTQNGGIWNIATSASWTGNGDGSNWTDTANWAPTIIPTDQADLRQPLASPRYINVDADSTVDTILMEDDSDNHLVLSANLTVDTIDGDHDKYKAHLHINNGHTLTLGQVLGPGGYTPILNGPGTFLKVSTGTATLQGAPDTFTGSFIVSNGTLNFRSSQYATTVLLTVLDGATAYLLEPGPSFPTNIVINGTGFGGAGALSFTGSSDPCASDITLASDSKITRLGTQTTTLTGDITGPGVLTLDLTGGATVDLDGVYNCALSGTNANSIIANGGTLDISGATLSVSGEESIGPFIKEFIIIDYSGGATVISPFAVTNDLKVNWIIDYDGTDDNPDAVVLVQLPTFGSVLEFE